MVLINRGDTVEIPKPRHSWRGLFILFYQLSHLLISARKPQVINYAELADQIQMSDGHPLPDTQQR
ncbi:hypothetical protein BDD30_1658 [Photorhabdus asymbiotica]|uniref:Uncharacterized protein n=1 Tax=Photorhabdus asymbiotica TaxID=291112 RepID=A0ABX9SNI3_9GAMM|nr:hypothetical protein BDD30_1658 [Photorhabdus asymbiotica]